MTVFVDRVLVSLIEIDDKDNIVSERREAMESGHRNDKSKHII
jgi:hypothetical protein